MQRKDVERICACAPFADQTAGIPEMVAALRAVLAERDPQQGQLNELRNGWANSVKPHADALAERDAAFAAGQEEMRERAAEQCDCALMDWEGDVLHDRAKAIRELPIKDSPDGR